MGPQPSSPRKHKHPSPVSLISSSTAFRMLSTSSATFQLHPPSIEPSASAASLSSLNDDLNRLLPRSTLPVIAYSKDSSHFQLLSAKGSSLVSKTMATLEEKALDSCVSRHLTEGGDDRLHLTPRVTANDPVSLTECFPRGVNKYFVEPEPPSFRAILRGSCTCSPPTRKAFDAAKRMLVSVWEGGSTFNENAFEHVRQRLLAVLGLSSVGNTVVLHPSGSDAELIPVLVAMKRAQETKCTRIVNIVTAAGEVGSGTAAAAGAKHFSKYGPLGATVECDRILDGMNTPSSLQVDVIELPPREKDGSLSHNYDQRVMATVAHQIEKEKNTFFILHVVDGSKTGLRVPSREVVDQLHETLGNRLLIVLDACQLRSTTKELQDYLDIGAILLVTSSKFFSAPGFCGAVVLPRLASNDLATLKVVPRGLGDYLTKLEVPPSLTAVHKAMPNGPANLGLLLRWVCGLTEMEAYNETPNVDQAAANWTLGARELVLRRGPAITLLDESSSACAGDHPTRIGKLNTIVSMRLRCSATGNFYNVDELRFIHRLLASKFASRALPSSATAEEKDLMDVPCFIGQPVKLGNYGVLRLALSAPLARRYATATPEEIAQIVDEDNRILDKMELIIRHFGVIRARL